MKPEYELKQIALSYGSGREILPVVQDFSLSVDQGDYVVLVGPSGTGKSTLLSSLAGFLRPCRGSLIFRGENLYEYSSAELADYRNRAVGIIPQFFNLISGMSALENVGIPAVLGGVAKKKALERAQCLLEKVGLDDESNRRVDELSGGQQQRVAIARALSNSPSVILADEPTGNLDARSSEIVASIFKKINQERGTTLIVATHDSDLASMARRVVTVEWSVQSATR